MSTSDRERPSEIVESVLRDVLYAQKCMKRERPDLAEEALETAVLSLRKLLPLPVQVEGLIQ